MSEEEQKRRFEARIEGSAAPVEAEPDGPVLAEPMVRVLAGARHHARGHRHGVAPWYIIPSDDKRRARLNCISHLLGLIPYEKLSQKQVKLPQRSMQDAYDDRATLAGRRFVAARY